MTPKPTEISLTPNKANLIVAMDNGEEFTLTAELLRVESPSAEIQGHGGDQKITLPNKRHVTITDIKPVGHYAIRIIFSDGHDSGLFSWDILYRYGKNADAMMQDYLNRLEENGLSR